jgi:hypothetical protein
VCSYRQFYVDYSDRQQYKLLFMRYVDFRPFLCTKYIKLMLIEEMVPVLHVPFIFEII